MDEAKRDWHRLFAVSWTDFFTGQPVEVDPEIDLSVKQQFLDVALLRKGDGELTTEVPDGFEDLARHNLVSFKSFQETLDGWSLDELIGHYVANRKMVSTRTDLLPESDFRLFAVTTRYPQNPTPRVTLRRVSDGVFDVDHFSGHVRIIVIHQLPQEEHNAVLHLFSALKAQVEYGRAHYSIRSSETTSFLLKLFGQYVKEGTTVPIDMQEFGRQVVKELLRDMPPEEREAFLQTMSPQERLAGLKPEQRLAGLKPEQRLAGLSPEEVIKALPPEALEALRRQLRAEEAPKDPK